MNLTTFKYTYELVQYLISHIDYFEGNVVLDEIGEEDDIIYDILTYSPYGIKKDTVYVNEDSIYIEIMEDESPDDPPSLGTIIAKGGYTVNIPYLIFTIDDKDDPAGLLPDIIQGSDEDVKVYNNFFTT